MMSNTYRAMIYTAVATMYFYNTEAVLSKDMTVLEFREQNLQLLNRVFQEVKEYFNYELSDEQMSRACYAYMYATLYPQSI